MIAALRTILARVLVALVPALAAACGAGGQRPSATAAEHAQDGAVILVQTPQHLDVALLTAHDLVASREASDVRVLACGTAVNALQAEGAAAKAIAERDRAHVHVLACGLSLERAGIAASSLAPDVQVVPNGIVEVLRLQRRGYRSVEL